MMNLFLLTMTLLKITSVHDVTMTIDNDYMHHTIYNYNYTVIYVDETYELNEEGEWIRKENN